MNTLDYILGGIVFFCLFLGVLSGILKQILGILCWGLSFYGGYLFYEKGGSLFYVPLVIIGIAIVFKITTKVIKSIFFPYKERRISFCSRLGGAFIGGLKGVCFVFLLLIIIHFFSHTLLSNNDYLRNYLGGSFFYSFLKNNNLLGISIIGGEKDGSIISDKNFQNKLFQDEEFLNILRNNPSLKEILEDEELVESIRKKDYKVLLSNPKFFNLFRDKKFLDKLSRFLSKYFTTNQN